MLMGCRQVARWGRRARRFLGIVGVALASAVASACGGSSTDDASATGRVTKAAHAARPASTTGQVIAGSARVAGGGMTLDVQIGHATSRAHTSAPSGVTVQGVTLVEP
jgi:hypothetical protein